MFLNSLLDSSFINDVTNYFANFEGTTNICRTVFLYVSIALALTLIICKLAIKREKQPTVNKVALFVAIGYAAATIVTFVVCAFVDDKMVTITFFPLLVFVLCCIVGGLIIVVKPLKAVKIAVISVIGAALIAVFVCTIVNYVTGDAADRNGVSKSDVSDVGLYISAAVLAAGMVLLALFADKSKRPFDSRTISFAAVCVALSFALSYVRIFKMPMGGSITFASTLPLMLFSYMFGTKKGLLAGVIYGMLQAVQDTYILHPAQFLLDYPIAFAGIGLAGCIRGFNLFKNNPRAQFALGATIAGILRFVSHLFSGVFAFGSFGAWYAADYGIEALTNPWVYSLLYQTMYVIPDLIIVLVVGSILFSSRSFVKQIERYTKVKTIANSTDEAAPEAGELVTETAASEDTVATTAQTTDTDGEIK